MKENEIWGLYVSSKLLARAVDWASLSKADGKFVYDTSTLMDEIEESRAEGLGSVSSTLLVEGEKVPTYKGIGYLVNGMTATIEHISESDSLSSGNSKNGNFVAFGESLKSLNELANNTKFNHSEVMNEVNVSIKFSDIVGLFYCKSKEPNNLMQIILMQKSIKEMTGKELPIFRYSSKESKFEPLVMSDHEKEEFFYAMQNVKKLRTANIYYNTQNGTEKHFLLSLQNQDDNKSENI